MLTASQIASEKGKLVENPQTEVSNHVLVDLTNYLKYNIPKPISCIYGDLDIQAFQQRSN